MGFLKDHKVPITIIVLFILLCMDSVKDDKNKEAFDQRYLYLSNATKCFSCEREMARRYGPEYAWMGQNSKCFSCEKQLARQKPYLGAVGNVSKCFSCMNQFTGEPCKEERLCNCGKGKLNPDGTRKCHCGKGPLKNNVKDQTNRVNY